MSSGRNQVALLTRGVRLPLPPINKIHLTVIAEAICAAWDKVLAELPTTAWDDPESLVNSALVTQLAIALRGRTPYSSLVTTVARGSEQFSYNGEMHEKRPDLNFYLTGRECSFPLIGECKIIDVKDRKDLDKYKKNGINRFIAGEYAWANVEGFMVAYVRDSSEAAISLATVTGAPPKPWGAASRIHYQSIHRRTFQYLDRDPKVEHPGEIALIHLWLHGATDQLYPSS